MIKEVIGDFTLYLGDCLEVMEKKKNEIENENIKLVLPDPPYGKTACEWDSIIPIDDMWEKLNKLIDDTVPVCIFGIEPFSSRIRIANIEKYKYDVICVKSIPTGHLSATRKPLRNVDIVSVFYTNQCTYNPQYTLGANKVWSRSNTTLSVNYGGHKNSGKKIVSRGIDNSLNYPREFLFYQSSYAAREEKYHDTQKSITLLEFFIKTYTNEKETVFDFTMGSGSTAIACYRLNRKFIGIEIDEEYFQKTCERITEEKRQLRLFVDEPTYEQSTLKMSKNSL